jgi:UDP-glucose 4-epimerase
VSGRVLVTGGAGFIGSHLVDNLMAAGERVTVLDDFSTGQRENLAEQPAARVRVVAGSILDEAAIEEALTDCDRVYHLAVQCVRRSLGAPRQSHDVNATGTLNVLECARRLGVRRFIYCSSSEVYGNTSSGLLNEDDTPLRPVTVYGAAKLVGEYYAEAYRQTYGLPTVVVRPFNAYGPRAHEQGDLAEVVVRFLIRVLNGLPPVMFGDGSNGRDFTYVTDVAHGLRLAGEADALVGQRVNIAFGRMITVREVAQTIMHVCGRNDLAVESAHPRPGDVHVLRADTRRASDVLGYHASIGFEDGIRRYVEWFRRRHPDPAGLLETTLENWTMPASASSASRAQVSS